MSGSYGGLICPAALWSQSPSMHKRSLMLFRRITGMRSVRYPFLLGWAIG